MNILDSALKILERTPLCDHCLGRQFALLGHGIENDERGKSLKIALVLKAHSVSLPKGERGVKALKTLATNGFSETAQEVLQAMNKHFSSRRPLKKCYLCAGTFNNIGELATKALRLLEAYDYDSFLVGIELPIAAEEREDEFRAEFDIRYGESMRNEFGRLIGKKIAESNGKAVDFMKPDVVVLVNPLSGDERLQVNPLFIAGRYRKIVRGIPQSKWFCSHCRGKGCERCNWTGKMYAESVEEIIGLPILDVAGGVRSSFHASGREDIDARMLGTGRPFIIEITQPRKRFLNLKDIRRIVNVRGEGKVEVSDLEFGSKDMVRRLKRGESKQKEYRVIMEFENEIMTKDLSMLKKKLTAATIEQRTPIRVLHRRADLTREKYIYDVGVKKLSQKKAEMKIRCQGGLYVKELVTGDEGRTRPSVSEILKNRAKPMKLDVLSVIMGD